jgi:hypothetical protein
MDQLWPGPIGSLLENLAANIVAAFLGVVAAWLIRHGWEKWRFGRWRVVVVQDGVTRVDRAISVGKAKEILQEPAELSVFLKGLVSPYDTLHCDIIQEGEKLGLLNKDSARRIYTIDLDENPKPPKDGPSLKDVMAAISRVESRLAPAVGPENVELEAGPHSEREAATGVPVV